MARFDKISEIYEKYRVEYPEDFLKFITKEFGLNTEKIYCDLGCGSGKFTKRIISISKETHGVDISQEMLNIAKRIGYKFVPIKKDANEFVNPRRYDVIFVSHSFHWMDKSKVLRNISESLKKRGYIAIFWNNCLDINKEYYKKIQDLVRVYHKQPISQYRGINTSDILDKSGLFEKSIHKRFFFTKKYTIEEYLGLLKSKSYIGEDIPEKFHNDFFRKAKMILSKEGNFIQERFVTDLYFARVIA